MAGTISFPDSLGWLGKASTLEAWFDFVAAHAARDADCPDSIREAFSSAAREGMNAIDHLGLSKLSHSECGWLASATSAMLLAVPETIPAWRTEMRWVFVKETCEILYKLICVRSQFSIPK